MHVTHCIALSILICWHLHIAPRGLSSHRPGRLSQLMVFRCLTKHATCHAQVAGDSNVAGQVYPDQSLYPVNSVPMLVERINNALQRADQIEHAEGNVTVSHRSVTTCHILGEPHPCCK